MTLSISFGKQKRKCDERFLLCFCDKKGTRPDLIGGEGSCGEGVALATAQS